MRVDSRRFHPNDILLQRILKNLRCHFKPVALLQVLVGHALKRPILIVFVMSRSLKGNLDIPQIAPQQVARVRVGLLLTDQSDQESSARSGRTFTFCGFTDAAVTAPMWVDK
jgi:hypothetical protein